MTGPAGRERLVVLAIALAATLPTLHKAFHIDDVLYLRVAQQILLTPADPYQGQVLWDAPDGQPSPLFSTDFNPPLWKYVLAGAIAWLGREEWKLHLVHAAFVWAAALGLYSWSRRLTARPVWCVAMILLGPFFLPGQNLMLEGPLLCFVAWALHFQERGGERASTLDGLLAGLLLAAAVLTKYTAGLLLPILALGSILRGRPKQLAALLPPVIALAGWSLHGIYFHGQPHLGGRGVLFSPHEWGWDRVLPLLRSIGGVSVFGPAAVWILARRGRAGLVPLAIILLLAGGAAWLDLERSGFLVERAFRWSFTPLQMAHFLLFTANGAVTVLGWAWLAVGALRGRTRGEAVDGTLDAWIGLTLVFNVVSVPFQAVRHLLLALVPMTIRFSRALDADPKAEGLRRGMLLVSTLLGAALADADYHFAGYYRDLARGELRRAVRPERTTWFTGNWGWVYYASQKDVGAYPLLERPEEFGLPPLRPGDIIFNPKLLSWKPFPPDRFPPVRAVEHLQPATGRFLRTIGPNVNYYAVTTHALPWELLLMPPGPEEKEAWYVLPPLDDVVIYQVQGGAAPLSRGPADPDGPVPKEK